MGAPDFSRRSFTSFASIFSATLISLPSRYEKIVLCIAIQLRRRRRGQPRRRCQRKSVATTIAATLLSVHDQNLQCALSHFLFVQRRLGRWSLADAAAQGRIKVNVFGRWRLCRRHCLTLSRRSFFSRERLVSDKVHALSCRVGDLRGKQANRAKRIIVTRNHVIHYRRVAV